MRYLTAILFGLLAAGCGDKAADNLMTQASVLIEEHPDSALLALRQIDPSAISPAADARRRLLLAQTYSRTGAEADNDSLTAPALDYYERHGSGAERAYAWYFDAKVHHNAGDLGRAIKGYTQAMLYAERNRDKAGTTEAIETLSPLVGARDTMAFRFFAQQITLQNLIYHTFAEDWSTGQLLEERARIDMHELWTAPLTHGPASADDDDRTLYDIASAIIFYRAEQPDSAQYYIDRSLAHIKRFNQNNIGLYTIASAIHHRRGEDGKAYACAMQYIGKRDSLDKARQGVSVAKLEKRYRTANETALREAGLRYRIWIATLACLLLAAAVTGAVVGYRRKLRHRDAQLSEYLTLLESYRESHDSLTSRLDASNEREAAVKASLEGRFALLRDIAATYYTYGEGERLARKVKELALSPAMLADIVRMADLYNDRAVTRLRRQLPGWTPRNYDFAALVVAGFSAQEISVMLDMTLNGVYTLKSKLKRRIAESGAADREFFTRFFA